MRRSVAISMVLTLVLYSCGGDGSNEEPEVESASPTQVASESQTDTSITTTATTASEEPSPSAGEGTGTATVGDTTWTFLMSGDARENCDPDFQGFFFVVLFGQDENGGEAVLSLNAPNSGGPAVVQVGGTVITDELWIADASVHGDHPLRDLPQEIGATAVVDGNTVSGNGVFYEDRSLTETRQSGAQYEMGVVDGTFAVTCPAG